MALFPTDNALYNRRTRAVRHLQGPGRHQSLAPLDTQLQICPPLCLPPLLCEQLLAAPCPAHLHPGGAGRLPHSQPVAYIAPLALHPPCVQLVDRWARPANVKDFFTAFEQSYIKMTALNVASSGEAG